MKINGPNCDAIAVTGLVLTFSKKDFDAHNWLEVRQALLNSIRDSFEDVMDEKLLEAGWIK